MQRVVERLVLLAETTPPHRYWHGLDLERRLLRANAAGALAALAPTLRHARPEVRLFMARLVREVDRGAARELLRPLLHDPDDEVRLSACAAVVGEAPWVSQRGTEPLPPLDAATRDDVVEALVPFLEGRGDAFGAALRLLHLAGDRALPERLLSLLPGADPLTMLRALVDLGRVDAVVAISRGGSPSLRASAVLALGWSASPSGAVAEAILDGLHDVDPPRSAGAPQYRRGGCASRWRRTSSWISPRRRAPMASPIASRSRRWRRSASRAPSTSCSTSCAPTGPVGWSRSRRSPRSGSATRRSNPCSTCCPAMRIPTSRGSRR